MSAVVAGYRWDHARKAWVTVEAIGPQLNVIQARWLQTFLLNQDHVGRHMWRMLPNAMNFATGKPSYVGCQKCGKPKP